MIKRRNTLLPLIATNFEENSKQIVLKKFLIKIVHSGADFIPWNSLTCFYWNYSRKALFLIFFLINKKNSNWNLEILLVNKSRSRSLGLNKNFNFYRKRKQKYKTLNKYCWMNNFNLEYILSKNLLEFSSEISYRWGSAQ